MMRSLVLLVAGIVLITVSVTLLLAPSDIKQDLVPAVLVMSFAVGILGLWATKGAK